MVRIADVTPGSIAEELELRIGTRIIRINGDRVRDGIDFTYLSADPWFEMEIVEPSGDASIIEIEREPGADLGIVPAPDTVRECANECVFCFIDGNPPDVRESLWLRDDDFRLSFTYGSYVTLTNLGPKGFQRLIDQRISPLYVSVHATEPEVRIRLLKNQRSGLIMDQLRSLTAAGLEVHTQVVLCPEWNDGAHLDRTIDDLWSLGSGVATLSVVPVGLTRYNLGKPVRPLRPEEAATAIEQVERARSRALAERGHGWCYSADEMFLIADRPLPGGAYYDDWPLTENGVGAVRVFMDHLDGGIAAGAPTSASRVRIVTAGSMAPLIHPRRSDLERALRVPVDVITVENRFFGPSVTVAGLMAGRDVIDAVRDCREGDLILLPADALNDDNLFIDSTPLDDAVRAMAPARVVTAHQIMDGIEGAEEIR